MFGRCALRLRKCIHFARERGVLSRRSAAGSGPLVARHRQVHASCEAETGNGLKRRSAKQTHRYSVLGYKGARRKRLALDPCGLFSIVLRDPFHTPLWRSRYGSFTSFLKTLAHVLSTRSSLQPPELPISIARPM